jgi:hypothetical protein
MALTQVTGPYPIFTDLDGTPLDDGYLYIGLINQDPEQNPIQVFWDSNLTIPATQPIRTSNGYAYRNGTPALLYTGGEFSITIRNKREEFVLYSPVGYGFDPAAVSASVVKNDFVGDGVTVAFVLSASPSTILATNIFINGVYQEKDSYTLSGNTITFSIAPPLSSSIEIMTNETGVINSGNANDISYTLTAAGATLQSVQTKLEQTVSVMDFGAVGDGVADDTAAFRAACFSLVPVTAAIAHRGIYVPPGRYKITDTVYIHAGNVLFGSGMSTFIDASGFPLVGTDPVFKLGWWLNGSTPVQDTAVGDLPPEIFGMFVLGGPGGSGGAVVDLTFPGGIIHDIWFSAPGTAINLAGGNVFDCLIDGGLTGITVNGANQRIDNVQFFNPNYGITLDGTCADTSIQGCTFEYCEYEAISVNGAGCDGVKIVGCNFFYNVQYATIAGAIRLRNSNQTVNVESCQFTNMKGPAIVLEQTGTNKKLHVQACVFNGEKSLAAYAQSTTSAGVYVQSGRAVIQSSRFISLRGHALSFGSVLGGNFADCSMSDCVITATDTTVVANDIGILSTQYGDSLRLSSVTGSGGCPLFAANVYCYPSAIGLQNWFEVENTPGTNFVQLPVTHGASLHVKMRVNTLQSGSFDYIKNIYEIVDVSTGYNGATQESQIDTQVIYQSPTTAPVPDIALTAGFTSIAGPTTLVPPIVGNIILSWPDTYGPADLDIQIN